MAKRIFTYKCSTCLRELDKFDDGLHSAPLRCTLTQACQGTFSLVKRSSGVKLKSVQPVYGLKDRLKRGSTTTAIAAVQLDRLSLATDYANTMVFAEGKVTEAATTVVTMLDSNGATRVVYDGAFKYPSISITASFAELSIANLAYEQVAYVRTGTAVTVSGVGDIGNPKALNTTGKAVRVLVNGELLPPSRYTYTSDKVTFTPELTGTTLLIDVFMYKAISTLTTSTKEVVFASLAAEDPLRLGSAYGDVGRINGMLPFYSLTQANLNPNKIYVLTKLVATDVSGVPFTLTPSGFMCLANAPYMFADKVLQLIVNTAGLIQEEVQLGFMVEPTTGKQVSWVEGAYATALARSLNNQLITGLVESTRSTKVLPSTQHVKALILGPT